MPMRSNVHMLGAASYVMAYGPGLSRARVLMAHGYTSSNLTLMTDSTIVTEHVIEMLDGVDFHHKTHK